MQKPLFSALVVHRI